MMKARNVLDLIGNTPLLYLKDASEMTGCEIYGKAEFLNPGQSVKDRAALSIIRAAEKSGTLKPGGIVVEGTAGNTGIGLAMVCSALGYRCKIVMPRTQSQEKKDSVKLLGAELIEVDAKPYSDPGNYIHVSERLAKELNENSPNAAVWANQFDNTANRDAHIATTGPEIWEQTEGKVDGFICGGSSGINVAGAIHMARDMGPGHTIVTILCDYGQRYQSKVYNPDRQLSGHTRLNTFI